MPWAPNRIIFIFPPTLVATTAFLVLCRGVRFGLFSLVRPTLFSLALSAFVSAMSTFCLTRFGYAAPDK